MSINLWRKRQDALRLLESKERGGRRLSPTIHTPSLIVESKRNKCHWHTQWATVPWCILKTICLPPVKPFLKYRSALEVLVSVWGLVILPRPRTARDHPRYCVEKHLVLQAEMKSSGCAGWPTVLSLRDKAMHADGKRDHSHKRETGKDIKVSGALLALLSLMFCLEPLDFSWVALTTAYLLDLPDLFCFWSEVVLVSHIWCVGSVSQSRAH